MLQSIRDRAQGLVTWVIVGLIVLSFALWGVSEYLTDGDTGMQVATIDGEDVSFYEYQVAYQNERARMQQMFGENFDPDMFDDQIKRTALDRVIDNTVVTKTALNAGFRVSNEQLAMQVQSVNTFQEEGKFSKEIYQQVLRSQGETVGGFEYRIRRMLLADQVILGVAATGLATSYEIEQIYRLQEQEREVGYLVVSADQFKEKIEPNEQEIADYYEKHKDNYKTQEKVKLDYLELSVDELMSDISVDQSELENYYDDQKQRFAEQDQVSARHILIEIDPEADSAASEQALATIKELQEKIKNGESFDELAKSQSQDLGSAQQGGDLGFFGKGMMDEAFEEVAFALEIGEVSEPVRSQFGYHLIKLEEKKPGGEKSLGDVKNEITQELKKQKAQRLYFDRVEILANLAYEAPESLEPAAEALGLKIKTSDLIPRLGGEGIFAHRKVREAAFSHDVLKEGLNSETIDVGDSQSIVVRLREHQSADSKPLSDVKEQVVSQLKQDKAKEQAKALGETLFKDLADGKEPVELAKSHDLTWTERTWVKRNDTTLNHEIIKSLFSLALSTDNDALHEGLALANGDFAVFSFYALRDGDITKLTDEKRSELRNQIANSSGSDEFSLLLDALKKKVEIKRFTANL